MKRILIAEDEVNIRESIQEALSAHYEAECHSSAESALSAAESGGFDLLITDIKMGKMTGIELLTAFKKKNPDTPVIVMTAYSSVQSAVEAMKAGADEYVPKPFPLEELEIKVRTLLEKSRAKKERDYYRDENDKNFGDMAGASPQVKKIKDEILKLAPSDITVLICGETGTGKELAAYTIHRLSGRKGPFVPVHCAALSRGVFESELFGHEKGAFTGADRQRAGKIEYAEDGTLFIDELGDIPPDIQVKLLRVLENRAYERVGGNRQMTTNSRIICATNRDLPSMVKSGQFREDLYYRVNVFPLILPPLRERREDIPLLADIFASKRGSYTIDEAGRNALMNYNWPGNIRELQNIIDRAVILSDGGVLEISKSIGASPESAAPESVSLSAITGGKGLEAAVEEIEKSIIEKTLKKNSFNQSKTAKELGLNRTTLQYKLAKYSIRGQNEAD